MSNSNKHSGDCPIKDDSGNCMSAAMLAIVGSVQDPLFTVSFPDCKIMWFNKATSDYFQQVRGLEICIGMTPEELSVDSQRAALFRSYYDAASRDGKFDVIFRSPGEPHVFRMRFNPIHVEDACVGVAVSATDISELDEAKVHLANSEEMYRSLFQSMGEGAVFQDESGKIVAVNSAAESIEGRTAAEMMGLTSESPVWGAVREDGSAFPGAEHPSMVTLRTGEPQTGIVMGIRRPSGERRWVSINSMPVSILGNARSKAVVTTFHDITNQRSLEAQLKEQVKRLDGALEQSLAAMSDMIEIRDPYTAGHERSVAKISAAIGEVLGWDAERCATLTYASLVHDIGKIAIPAEILVKPSRLTPIEYELVKMHVDFGYRILKNIDFARPIAEIVRQHHERLDGSGYPLGLVGEQILPEARVVAVADVVDSMISHRPYRPALGIKVAMDELESNVGRLYDERVVEAMRYLVAQQFFAS